VIAIHDSGISIIVQPQPQPSPYIMIVISQQLGPRFLHRARAAGGQPEA
jgi:hypothetical protein